MKPLLLFLSIALLFAAACRKTDGPPGPRLSSPSGQVWISFFLAGEGVPMYRAGHGERVVIDSSRLGFTFENSAPIIRGLVEESAEKSSVDETWEMPWGEQRTVRNHYNELLITLRETNRPERVFHLRFRAYDDGIGFRYEFPEQEGWDQVEILEENTEFQLTGDHTVWWGPGDWDIYEHLYHTTRFSDINAMQHRNHENLAQTTIRENAVNTPVTMRTESGLHLSFHEASLTDYAGMTLRVEPKKLKMMSSLVGSDRAGHKVKRELPFVTPWRTIQMAERAGDLIESKLILNLNDPNRLGDVSWFKPTKYTGIWWEMHLGKSSWNLASGKHGATTENAKALIDFSAANGIGAVLVEGWNTGWEGYDPVNQEPQFDFITPYPDYDLQEVVRYAREKGVELIMHHETSADVAAYEQQMDTAFALMKSLGLHAVKTGYVGKIIPEGEFHHGQWMVNHYRKVLEKAAEHEIAINAHEPIKATGIRRTLPNAIAREGLRGQEFNAWANDGGNPPEHLSIVAFTRMLAGPIDFTPGVFNIKLDPYKPDNQVNTTVAHQLALYVVVYSPVQMACDLIENYEGRPEFQFIRDVGVDWEQTKVLNGEVGEFVTIAREERGTGHWFVGGITDENARDMEIVFDFLEEGAEYEVSLYRDAKDAHWDLNPEAVEIEMPDIGPGDKLNVHLAAGGGFAISLLKKQE